MKIIYVGFKFAHHKGTQGGYHHISEYVKYDRIIDAQWEREFYESENLNFFLKALRRICIFFLGFGTPITILKCIYFCIFFRNQVFHFIYPENTYKWLHHFIGNSNKIVCTFHQPASYFLLYNEWIPIMRKFHHVILVSNSDIALFRNWTGRDNVTFIPHGINTEFYRPKEGIIKKPSLLMVGNWMRDFHFSNSVLAQLILKHPNIKIDIVTMKENFAFFDSLQVNLYTKISDYDLLDLYQNSKVVFFPLKEFTANNAILEAAACGCNIVVSSPSEVCNSYFPKDYITFLPNSVSHVVSEISDLIENDSLDQNFELHGFVKSNFSWDLVADRSKKILELMSKF